jgi:Ca2+-transporting ATPase
MVTGDHPETAVAVARAIGVLYDHDSGVLTGADIDGLSADDLREAVRTTAVFARVEPRHKPLLVDALRADGEVVAMTGDGVNDVGALRAADVGVAMGRRGTDAATAAADIVLTDDDYGTIVRAIGRGRAIYDDVVRFVHFLLAANLGEVIVFALALAAGFGAPLTVSQILVVNLLTDGPPAIALAFDPPAEDVMRRPPRPPAEGILPPIRGRLLAGALATGAAGFASFLAGHATSAAAGRTMAFVTLVVAQLAYVFVVRGDAPAWRAGRNRHLTAAVAGCAAAVVAALALEPLASALGVVAVDAGQLAVAVALAGLPAAVGEIEKAVRRRRAARSSSHTEGQR